MGFYRYKPILALSVTAVELEEEVETFWGCVRDIAQSVGPKQPSRDMVSEESLCTFSGSGKKFPLCELQI